MISRKRSSISAEFLKRSAWLKNNVLVKIAIRLKTKYPKYTKRAQKVFIMTAMNRVSEKSRKMWNLVTEFRFGAQLRANPPKKSNPNEKNEQNWCSEPKTRETRANRKERYYAYTMWVSELCFGGRDDWSSCRPTDDDLAPERSLTCVTHLRLIVLDNTTTAARLLRLAQEVRFGGRHRRQVGVVCSACCRGWVGG